MSSLIGAVKAYAYMDRGGLVEADVHEGLETTLKVLGHKLKHTEIEIQRDDSSPAQVVQADELGRFRVELVEGGRIRLCIARASGGRVETSWITV